MTFLELQDLLAHLPPESALRTAQRNTYSDEQLVDFAKREPSSGHGPWSNSDMLLAALFDAIQMLIHVQVARAGVKQDPPTPLRRPGVGGGAPREMSPQAVAYLERIRQLHEAAVAEEGDPQ